ncbi:MAG: hypothetical protein V4857_22160 [Pseudomonadota bacterium]
MGANADLRANIIDQTPLHYVMELLAALLSPQKVRRTLLDATAAGGDLIKQEVLRRHGVRFAGVYGDGSGALAAVGSKPRHQKLFELAMDAVVGASTERHTQETLFRITELLLVHGANPNAPHTYPVAGRTPLMLATEMDAMQTFDLMLKHRGDPFLTDAQKQCCRKLAVDFKAQRVIRFMRDNSIM